MITLLGLLVLLPTILAATIAEAQHLAFNNLAYQVPAGQCGAFGLNVRRLDANNNDVYTGSTVVWVSGVATGFFSDWQCTQSVNSITIPQGSSTIPVYFRRTQSGLVTITLNSTGFSAAAQTETIAPSVGTNLAFSVQPGTSATNLVMSPSPQITVTDTYGNPVTSAAATNISLTLTSNPSGGTLGGTTTLSTASGLATFSNLSLSAAGTGYTLTASASGLSPITSASFVVVGGVVPTATPKPIATPTAAPTATATATAVPTATPTPVATPIPTPVSNAINLSSVWANDGGDKVTQDELRAAQNQSSVINSIWNGSSVNLFGAKNEVVAFNLVLEASKTPASNVSVSFNSLTGPGGYVINSVPTNAAGVFNWTQRNIELFYIRYLQINGLSMVSYQTYDERQIPQRLQRPWTIPSPGGAAIGSGNWASRPDHNKYYPDIAVPLEAVPTFNVSAGSNQSVWADIYIPEAAPAGTYTGFVTVTEGAHVSYVIPVNLTVRKFTLSDTPSSKTMVYISYSDIAQRYTGLAWPNPGTAQDTQTQQMINLHYMMAHRHKISLIDDNTCATVSDQPCSNWIPRLNGSLFTAANGYAGPGTSVGNNIFSIGTFGKWTWQSAGEAGMWTHTNNWESWFETNFPSVQRFLYLIDESTNYPQTEQWAGWMKANPGVGKNLSAFATLPIPAAVAQVPDLDLPTSWFTVGNTSDWQNPVTALNATATKKPMLYNGQRPASGTFATEDDGVALRELAWGQYKKNINRWFFWNGTYYNNYQGGQGQTDLFNNAQTFGGAPTSNSVLGMTGADVSNGDGVLFYPGTDQVYPASSQNIAGPLASVRLKEWRRGIQDVDYIAMAAAINPAATQAIVNQMIPKALWEYGAQDISNPTWVYSGLSWSINPNDWEAARAHLANIIETGSP